MSRIPAETIAALTGSPCLCGAPIGKPCGRSDGLYVCPSRIDQADVIPEGGKVHTYQPRAEAQAEPDRDTKPSKWAGVNAAKARAREAGQERKRTKPEALFLLRLERLFEEGEVLAYMEQPASLRLGDGHHYRPDFLVLERGGLVVFYEVKGEAGWDLAPKGRAQFKSAGEHHRWATFRAAIWGGAETGWTFETYEPRGNWPPRGGEL